MWKISAFFLFILIFSPPLANPSEHKLVKFSSSDLASLQRGAKYFMNYCSGCHSLQYMRYNRLGVDLNIDDKFNSSTQQRLKDNLVFTQAKTSDTIKSNLQKKQGLVWFGKPPPDLSLSIRARNADWVYNYLLSFYLDDTRPFGVNNSFIKNTAMPDPLAIIRMDTHTYHNLKNTNDRLSLKISNRAIYSHSNKSSSKIPTLEEVVIDLVNFLAYIADPTKNNRQSLGKKVCGFLLVLTYFVYILKKQIWGNIKK
ncbi:cytochrome c1 [Rickettsiella endosymbiont of Aleochara curtula]|uniref:cytochrome c1 n=1 Tax=Rickettsiella endosymbiont of Aleochara curtula TaxID=3077936 RepID=UPI00313C1053